MSSSSSSFMLPSYVCVHCNTPLSSDGCNSLYRYLTPNSPASIKLTLCDNCGNVADPYLEREYLLVAMDWILLRPPAYRHVLCNQLKLYLLKERKTADDDNNNNAQKECSSCTLGKLLLRRMIVIGGLSSAIMEAYLQYQLSLLLLPPQQKEQQKTSNNSTTEEMMRLFVWPLQLVTAAWLGRILVWWLSWKMIEWSGTYSNRIVQSSSQRQQQIDSVHPSPPSSSPPLEQQQQQELQGPHIRGHSCSGKHHQRCQQHCHSIVLSIQLYMAWLLPTAFYGVAVVVMMWEPTHTVTSLTVVLILAMQFTALSSLLLVPPAAVATTIPPPTAEQQMQQYPPLQLLIGIFVVGLFLHVVGRWITHELLLAGCEGPIPWLMMVPLIDHVCLA